jgi:hypothetical protein
MQCKPTHALLHKCMLREQEVHTWSTAHRAHIAAAKDCKMTPNIHFLSELVPPWLVWWKRRWWMKDFSSGPWYNASTVTPTEQSTKPETLTTPWDLFKFKDSILQNLEQKYSKLHESLVSLIYYVHWIPHNLQKFSLYYTFKSLTSSLRHSF